MQRLFRRSPLVQCPVDKAVRRHRCQLVASTRSGLRDEVAQLNLGKSPVEELSGETNTMVTDVMDIDRTPELLTWLFSSFFGRGANQPNTTSPPTPTSTPTDQVTTSSPKSSTTPSSATTPNSPTTPSSAATAAATAATPLLAPSVPANTRPDGNRPNDQPSTSLSSPSKKLGSQPSPPSSDPDNVAPEIATATLGGGCFWCIEACFRELEGVVSVTSGYAGGHVPNPTYQQVCSKTTGHAEVVQVKYDANVLSYKDLLQIFMALHDPTTPNRSGNDLGPQYRSIILTHDDSQAQVAAEVLAEANRALWFGRRVCTEVAPLSVFYPAEPYHQRYYSRNPEAGYCVFVVQPKLQEFRRKYGKRLRRDASLSPASLL
ncbi:hypothetical protein VOLCADRAFT_79470 [Volvox carteri f. nagariensis]|uniref:peptide-methionine (S)-S-oxide reductase n=1 Tax=Volvox carteri f. nagariensis TaxID=3068 RepID=D8TL39_VOLCA|nr:uncharacterized protein VOLCADRAFT_79470 [Volvox carteri f. nagariensis]EFJ51671.1 hypothetical protein VOLCADRAFT_79470 [Volvox carteri f. nagariensis]|eukprot:XP_002947081.1 hypothetical protein VOLCADRAFT_79470 [Volvox carteri f. nagariensis]